MWRIVADEEERLEDRVQRAENRWLEAEDYTNNLLLWLSPLTSRSLL
jgi:hypothetical protein